MHLVLRANFATVSKVMEFETAGNLPVLARTRQRIKVLPVVLCDALFAWVSGFHVPLMSAVPTFGWESQRINFKPFKRW